jgi:predicted flap endonuclease-1-like 5' DNA nuclease
MWLALYERVTHPQTRGGALTDDEPDTWPPGVGAPARRALGTAGYTHLAQLAGVPRRELAALHGMGPKALRVLEEALVKQGMSLG